MTRKPVFTKKGGTELYTDNGQFLGYGHFESDLKFKKGKQTYYMISYGKIIDSSNSLSEIKRKGKKHAKIEGNNTKIVKLEGEYIPIW